MAGSKTWRTYTDDTGVSYSFQQDKGWANSAIISSSGDSFTISLTRSANLNTLPPNIIPRYIIVYPYVPEVSDPIKRKTLSRMGRKIIVGNPNFYQAISDTTVTAIFSQGDIPFRYAYHVIGFISGEKRKITPRLDDTRYS